MICDFKTNEMKMFSRIAMEQDTDAQNLFLKREKEREADGPAAPADNSSIERRN